MTRDSDSEPGQLDSVEVGGNLRGQCRGPPAAPGPLVTAPGGSPGPGPGLRLVDSLEAGSRARSTESRSLSVTLPGAVVEAPSAVAARRPGPRQASSVTVTARVTATVTGQGAVAGSA